MKMDSGDISSVLQKNETEKLALIRRLADRAHKKLGKKAKTYREGARFFVQRYYANVPPEDIFNTDEETLLGFALSAWDHIQTRKKNQAKVRVFNCAADGKRNFSSPHTIIEIINDDMPFLVDSVTAELNRQDLTVLLVIHPVIDVRRDKAGKLLEVGTAEAGEAAVRESVMHVEINEQSAASISKIKKALDAVLRDVRAAVNDWRRMRVRVADVIAELDSSPPPIARAEVEETKSFLRWVEDNHFTFLGYREFDFMEQGEKAQLRITPKSGLGILRQEKFELFDGLQNRAELPDFIADFIRKPQALMVSKANRRSTVHRAVHLDTIGVKRFDDQGNVVGERVFAGLFASDVYNQAVREIPLLRGKVDAILTQVGYHPNGHDGKALMHILETMPRDELLQVDTATLAETSVGILHLQDRQRVALFVHRDPFGRFASCLVYVPRDRFSTDLRMAMKDVVERGFGGEVTAQYTQVSDSVLARLHFIVKLEPGTTSPQTDAQIDEALGLAARSWSDDLADALVQTCGEKDGLAHLDLYRNAFPPGYSDEFTAAQAVQDIGRIKKILETGAIGLNLYRPSDDAPNEFRFGLYHTGDPVPLSDVLPMLENMGLTVVDEVPHCIRPGGDGAPVWLHDFGLLTKSRADVDIDASAKERFEEAFHHIWLGDMENDGFNSLVLGAGLSWRQVVILRAYCKYLLQAKIPFSQSYMEETLAGNPGITRDIVALFESLFDPAGAEAAAAGIKAIKSRLAEALDAVVSLDEDRILRRFVNIVEATLRTNFYQFDPKDGPKSYLSLKLDSGTIDELPLPRPFREIFVHSPRVDAVHLRGGKVARGGLRWSDRREDFRTEILGLMKSQMTKNSVIVPVGAKGGFVVKNPPQDGGRDAFLQEGIACYKIFMSGMLDITDNIKNGRVVPPKDVVRRDEDDPYLVVAADKGTATFSDIANGVARDYGFWLDDAFASGGSDGYDHKAMGITARGAWESVKRHFREIGIDTMEEDFTCVGVGDMSGDVFGNGLIYSPHTKLLGAFNHLHIFVDPDPDPAASFKERERLFDMGRSSWTDYNPKLISKGGGIFERSAKSIKVTPEMRNAFGLAKRDNITPNDLIREMLKSKVDLLWFGGIGTYVKSSGESNLDAGDRANDALRINGPEVGARIIGEGANLGVTQLGRVEYALAGGRINTDFIDNSAGVDCSDHEVNIKILLHDAVSAKKLTMKDRNKLLRRMTDEVSDLVQMDNYRQSMALTNAEHQSIALVEEHKRFMQALERAGDLDRDVEFLPDDETIDLRSAAGKGLTRPELSVLLCYAKIVLYEDILESDLPDDEYLADNLPLYFPGPMQKQFPDFIPKHRLRREIIATYATNTLINRTGPSFITTMQARTGAHPAAIARAYLICRQVFGVAKFWNGVESLDNSVPAETQTEMHLEILRLVERGTLWFLRHAPASAAINDVVASYCEPITRLGDQLDKILSKELADARNRKARAFAEKKTPEALAQHIANLDSMAPACDIVRIAATAGHDLLAVARVYYGLGAKFGFDWLRRSAQGLADGDEWRNAAVDGLVDDLFACQTALTTRVVDDAGDADVAEMLVDAGIEANRHEFDRVRQLVNDLKSATPVDLAMLMVVNRHMRAMIGG